MKIFRFVLLAALIALVAHPSVAGVLGPGGFDDKDTYGYTDFDPSAYGEFWGSGGLDTGGDPGTLCFTDPYGGASGPFYSDDLSGYCEPGSHDPTPEPSSLFLMGSGLLAIGGTLRRRLLRI